jgi:hypothetical protein
VELTMAVLTVILATLIAIVAVAYLRAPGWGWAGVVGAGLIGLAATTGISPVASAVLLGAFALVAAVLNFAGLPGLSQLGTIVGLGVLLAPVVMMFLFLPLALRWSGDAELSIAHPADVKPEAATAAAPGLKVSYLAQVSR